MNDEIVDLREQLANVTRQCVETAETRNKFNNECNRLVEELGRVRVREAVLETALRTAEALINDKMGGTALSVIRTALAVETEPRG